MRISQRSRSFRLFSTFLILFLLCNINVHAFKYNLDDAYYATSRWSFTEMYMYGSQDSQVFVYPFSPNKDSYIDIDFRLRIKGLKFDENAVCKVLFYSENSDIPLAPAGDLCENSVPTSTRTISRSLTSSKIYQRSPTILKSILASLSFFNKIKDKTLEGVRQLIEEDENGNGNEHENNRKTEPSTEIKDQESSLTSSKKEDMALVEMNFDNYDIINPELHSFYGEYSTQDGEWIIDTKAHYKVEDTGLQNVLFQVCPSNIPLEITQLSGEIAFRNPYGYLPGRFYGYLPFEFFRFLLFLMFDIYYLVLLWKYRNDLINLHKAFSFVLVISSAEALAWFLAFDSMNQSGVAYCCPFPTVVIVAMVFEIIQKLFGRGLLLVVSLGYGITRPKLRNTEWISLSVLSIIYFTACILEQTAEINEANNLKPGQSSSHIWYSFPALLCDIIYLSWIYVSLTNMMKQLKERKETYKYTMYYQLSLTILVFVSLFSILTFVVLLSRNGYINWPWELAWAETVSWEILNFAVLAAICYIWRPSPTSKYLSQAIQLPSSDVDIERDIDMEDKYRDDDDGDGGMELGSTNFAIDDDDDILDDDVHLNENNRKSTDL